MGRLPHSWLSLHLLKTSYFRFEAIVKETSKHIFLFLQGIKILQVILLQECYFPSSRNHVQECNCLALWLMCVYLRNSQTVSEGIFTIWLFHQQCMETGSLYLAQASLKLSVFLSQCPACWGCRHAPQRPSTLAVLISLCAGSERLHEA